MTHRALDFIDRHPRTGWYLTVVVTLDFILHLIESHLL